MQETKLSAVYKYLYPADTQKDAWAIYGILWFIGKIYGDRFKRKNHLACNLHFKALNINETCNSPLMQE